jgi:LysR family transcriptional regulator, hydrogen peroxide-inducible genes activator
MELHQIRYFHAVAECRSFTAAARRQHVSQPTLSHQVLKLEDELGAKLFHRMGRVVQLTEFGDAFLSKAKSILQQIDSAKVQIREMSGEGGVVNLGVIPTVAPFFLPVLLARFLKEHPSIEVKIVEEPSTSLVELVREGAIDLAIVPLPVRGNWASTTELMTEKLYAVVANGHPLTGERQITLKQLAGAPFLSLKDGHCFRDDVMASFRNAHVEPKIVFESGCFLTILNMVKAGIGISVVPEMAVNQDAGCIFIPVRGDRPVRVVGMLQSKQRVPTRALELFTDFLQKSANTANRTIAK